MAQLKTFLENTNKAIKNWKSSSEIHIVLGNESCDLDSTICCLAYGYLLSEELNNPKKLVLPILNVSREDFRTRTEHCTLLKDISIDLEKLLYRSEVNFQNFFEDKSISVKTYLVDHHVLCKNDVTLQTSVCKIFDHRPLNENMKWSNTVLSRIELVGSCATLIADEFLKKDGLLFKELAYLLYCTIVYDTLAVDPKNKKATLLDIEIATKLENKFNFNESREDLFKKLTRLHSDITNLSVQQILIRDLKYVNNIPIPGLPMLVENFVKLKNVEECLREMSKKCNCPFIILIGIEHNPNVRRDVGLFYIKNDENFNKLVEEFKNKKDFEFKEKSCDMKCIVLLDQLNIEKSRKQIIPIVENFMKNDFK